MSEGTRFIVIVSALLLSLGGASAGNANDINGDDRELILLPLALNGHVVSGGYGTRWTGEVYVYNGAGRSIGLAASSRGCHFPGCGIYFTEHLGRLDNGPLNDHPEYGLLLMTSAADAPNLTLSSRMWEISRHGQPRGVDLPVVREGDFFKGPVAFLAVPGGSDVRVSLRVYNPWVEPHLEVKGAAKLKIEFIDLAGSVLEETELVVERPGGGAPCCEYPGFAGVYDVVAAFPVLNGKDSFHVRVTPTVPGAQFYAMVAVTDNETQTVSIITAQ